MIIFDSATDMLTLSSQTVPYTFCGWAKLNTDSNATGALCYADDGIDGSGLGVSSTGTTLLGFVDGNIAGSTGSIELIIGEYFFWAITRNNTDNFFTWYHCSINNNSFTAISELAVNSVNGYNVRLGNNGFGMAFSGSIGIIKKFNKVLVANDLINEKSCILPKTAGCVGWWPTVNHSSTSNSLVDYSGNNLNWTIAGTLSSEDNPPIPWGSSWLPDIFVPGNTSPVFTQTNTNSGNFLTL